MSWQLITLVTSPPPLVKCFPSFLVYGWSVHFSTDDSLANLVNMNTSDVGNGWSFGLVDDNLSFFSDVMASWLLLAWVVSTIGDTLTAASLITDFVGHSGNMLTVITNSVWSSWSFPSSCTMWLDYLISASMASNCSWIFLISLPGFDLPPPYRQKSFRKDGGHLLTLDWLVHLYWSIIWEKDLYCDYIWIITEDDTVWTVPWSR